MIKVTFSRNNKNIKYAFLLSHFIISVIIIVVQSRKETTFPIILRTSEMTRV